MKITVAKAKWTVRANMTDRDAFHYVPIQKFSCAMCLYVVAKYCERCGKNDEMCEREDCVVKTLGNRLVEALTCPPIFDEGFNLLPPPKVKREGVPE